MIFPDKQKYTRMRYYSIIRLFIFYTQFVFEVIYQTFVYC